MFFWYNFFIFVRHAVKNKELADADKEAVATVGTTIGHVIQETTGWSIGEIFRSRMNEYDERSSTELPAEVFSRVLLRSVGKQTIEDPDRRLDPLSLDITPTVMEIMIHMTAWLPAYSETYKNAVHNYPMD